MRAVIILFFASILLLGFIVSFVSAIKSKSLPDDGRLLYLIGTPLIIIVGLCIWRYNKWKENQINQERMEAYVKFKSEQEEKRSQDSINRHRHIELSFKDFVLGESYNSCMNKALKAGYLSYEYDDIWNRQDTITKCFDRKCKVTVESYNDTIYKIILKFVYRGNNDIVGPSYRKKYGTTPYFDEKGSFDFGYRSNVDTWNFKNGTLVVEKWGPTAAYVTYIDSSYVYKMINKRELIKAEVEKEKKIEDEKKEAERQNKINKSINNDI